ncbi:glycosyltransferase family 2 protein [Pseudodesulfovibrio piezophilus]|nr:glycosyltransferase [Pseudodesulfovibrio piezophilus]
MNEQYFQIYQYGMAAQLKELTLDEMVEYVLNHLHNFLLDESVSFCFIERFANDPETGKHTQATRALLYLLDKALQLRPFRPGLLGAVVKLTGNTAAQQRMDLIAERNLDKEIYDQISGLDIKKDAEDVATFIAQLIKAHPDHIAAAQFALTVDRHLGIPYGHWRDDFVCPQAIRRDWDIALFNHHASLCDYDSARKIWDSLHMDMVRETSLNMAAEMFIASGDRAKGIALYKASLEQDPRQTPVRLRVRELEHPFQPDASLTDSSSVSICLYSWNKGEILGQTLQSLSRSNIGSATLHILLNGCTDDSRAIVDAACPLFPNNKVVIHDLHVNIGAPAARNWLMRLPEVQESQYIAFLDDDVTVPENWLASFLTVAEQDDSIGVVGCKIVHPGMPSLIQYLFRYVAIADHGLLKMSIHSPLGSYDTHSYDYIRETRNVMGCLHLLRTSAVKNIKAGFDIRFSPSQVDDIDHDIAVCLEGHKVMYCGLVTCVHHQSSGVNFKRINDNIAATGSTMGNDIKFYFKHLEHMHAVKALDNLSLDLGVRLPEF